MAAGSVAEPDPRAGAPPVRYERLLAAASRAPSIHNTQPWRFRIADGSVELHLDPERRLTHIDPEGRQAAISCGAALFGLRLGVRQLGHEAVVDLLPHRGPDGLLARVHLGAPAPLTPDEESLLSAVALRHTHRGPFTAQPLPEDLLTALRADAQAEHAALVSIDVPRRREQLATLVSGAELWQRQQPLQLAEIRRWTRHGPDTPPDGVPASAYPAQPEQRPGGLAQRDFDLGRGWGTLPATGSAEPAVTAVLTTPDDTRADWLRAGQALYRLLLRAARDGVLASLHSQPIEVPPLRTAIVEELRLTGCAQMVLQLGRAGAAAPTGRRPVGDLLQP